MLRKVFTILLILVFIYLGIRLAFHLKWERELKTCRETLRAQGEFVEPEVFGGLLGLVFDVTNWPVYAWANIYHDGTPFATSCTHSRHSRNISAAEEEGAVRYVVESFGKRLQNVPLQSPDVAQTIREQYTEFVSPELLEAWMDDLSKAPGRMVSSPWPDRIEITDIVREEPDRYAVTGFVIEITSVELVNGGVAAKIPVHIIVERQGGRWIITEYAEER